MRFAKKIIAIITCVVLTALMFTTTVTAENIENNPTDNIKIEYIDSRLKDYLSLQGYSTFENIYISNSFPIYNFDDNSVSPDIEIYFIFENDSIIGMMTVGMNNGEYSSKYSEITNNVLSDLYTSKTEFAVGYLNNKKIIAYDNGYEALSENTSFSLETINQLEADTVALHKDRAYNAVMARSTVLFNKVLNVTHIANKTTSDGKGLCWASCIAMKVNTARGKISITTPWTVYNRLVELYGETPSGNITWYRRAYAAYDIGCTYLEEGVGSSVISTALNNNRTIQIGLKTESGSADRHAVLIVGCTIYSNHAIYVIDDPNIKEKQYQDVSYSAMSNPDYFVYYAYDSVEGVEHEYNIWTKTIY